MTARNEGDSSSVGDTEQAAQVDPAMAPSAADGSQTRLPAAASGGVRGWLKWLGYQALGLALATPMALKLLVQFVTKCVSRARGCTGQPATLGCWAGAMARPSASAPRSAALLCWGLRAAAPLPAPSDATPLPAYLPACSPRRTLYRKDRNHIQYPDPLPGLTHEWLETAPGVKCARLLDRPLPLPLPLPPPAGPRCCRPHAWPTRQALARLRPSPACPPAKRAALPSCSFLPEPPPLSVSLAGPSPSASAFARPATPPLPLPPRIHMVRTSKGSGKPLMLMVHGFPEAWFSWRAQMAAFRCGGPGVCVLVCARTCAAAVWCWCWCCGGRQGAPRRWWCRRAVPRCAGCAALCAAHVALACSVQPPHPALCRAVPCCAMLCHAGRDQYEIVAIDMRGYGESSKPPVGAPAAALRRPRPALPRRRAGQSAAVVPRRERLLCARAPAAPRRGGQPPPRRGCQAPAPHAPRCPRASHSWCCAVLRCRGVRRITCQSWWPT